jgi:hypothetical protein
MRAWCLTCLLLVVGCDPFSSGETGVGGMGGGGGAPVDPLACASPMLVDDFDDGVVGILELRPAVAGERTGIRTGALDWSNVSITLELSQIEKTDATGMLFEVTALDDMVSFAIDGPDLVATSHPPSGPDPFADTPFVPADHRFWRILANAGENIEWQTSADGVTWRKLLNAVWVEVMSDARLNLYAADAEMDAAARYERITVCPL